MCVLWNVLWAEKHMWAGDGESGDGIRQHKKKKKKKTETETETKKGEKEGGVFGIKRMKGITGRYLSYPFCPTLLSIVCKKKKKKREKERKKERMKT